jgi:hypothetical protein
MLERGRNRRQNSRAAAWTAKARAMSIGVFDSGVGGLTVHRALVQRLPQADFTYLADQANAPYGVRTGEEVVELTRPAASACSTPAPAWWSWPATPPRPSPCAACSRPGCPATASSSADRSTCWASSCRPSRRPPACPGSTRPNGAATRSSSWTCWACSRPRPRPLARLRDRDRQAQAGHGGVLASLPGPGADDRGRRRRRRPGQGGRGLCPGAEDPHRPLSATAWCWAAPTTRSSPTSSAPPCRPAPR